MRRTKQIITNIKNMEKQQLKFFFYGFLVAILVVVSVLLASGIFKAHKEQQNIQDEQTVNNSNNAAITDGTLPAEDDSSSASSVVADSTTPTAAAAKDNVGCDNAAGVCTVAEEGGVAPIMEDGSPVVNDNSTVVSSKPADKNKVVGGASVASKPGTTDNTAVGDSAVGGDTVSLGENTFEKTAGKGDTLGGLLNECGVPYAQIASVRDSLKDVFDIKRDLRPKSATKDGTKLQAVCDVYDINPTTGATKNNLTKLTIFKSPIEKVVVSRQADGSYKAEKVVDDKIIKYVRADAVIQDGESLSTAMVGKDKQNVPFDVIARFYDVFSFDVDFEREIRPGDKVHLYYEKEYSQDGKYLGAGKLIYGKMKLRGKTLEVYRYTKAGSKDSNFYDEDGKGVTKSLKKSPINKARISSVFGMRKHPVLGFTRMHAGVDFAAPKGTPIPAAGTGTIVWRGWVNGYGNYIKIRHNAHYTTAYGHMSAFKTGQSVGTFVKQGEIVGFVGSTGVSTGPHLHYEIIKDGVKVNPLTLNLPSTDSLAGDDLKKFKEQRKDVDAQMKFLEK